ncbi:hypothetical protein SAMN06272735_8769 [Streptomyces sp. TLI_55]|uniref:DUF2255 family protein n=1 Tax=Streptomyces sp. TLI_55 TaxID=1938861 RepID=UPI000BD8764A|nr:DUF2255 family protein [Streptomyces sp. TLI_55]SNX88330.1 hypothetical protein SAMN06272735_8769 [Streptomyces sp. TLI_55]
MTAWKPEDQSLFSEAYSLFLTAGDSDRPGVEIGMVVVDGELYVRAYRGVRSRWYQAARTHGHGTIQVGDVSHAVVLTTEDLEPPIGLDAAFRTKYGPIADALVAGPEARAATIRIDPTPEAGFRTEESLSSHM